jgi:hypothetical protein
VIDQQLDDLEIEKLRPTMNNQSYSIPAEEFEPVRLQPFV